VTDLSTILCSNCTADNLNDEEFEEDKVAELEGRRTRGEIIFDGPGKDKNKGSRRKSVAKANLVKKAMTDKLKRGYGRLGKANDNNNLLLRVIRSILPASKSEWEEVAEAYMKDSSETVLRSYGDLKIHFIKKMCKSNIKITGSSGPNDLTRSSQKVYIFDDVFLSGNLIYRSGNKV
jgi:hypothetical protein